jgi:hypothetical protein
MTGTTRPCGAPTAREGAQRGDRGLDEERRDAEAEAVARLERFLAALAQGHQLGHVHLVEGGEHGRGVLCGDEIARDGQAALRHALARLGASPGRTWRRRRYDRRGRLGGLGRQGRWRRRGSRSCWTLRRRSRRRRNRRRRLDLAGDVLLGDAAGIAAAGDSGQRHVVRLGHLARRRGGLLIRLGVLGG